MKKVLNKGPNISERPNNNKKIKKNTPTNLNKTKVVFVIY
jgi:hypothetical protein